MPDPDEPSRFWAIVQGVGIFETTDDGASWTPRNTGPARATGRAEHEEIGFCVHKLVHVAGRPRAASTSRTTSASTAATTAASRGRRSPRACRREFGFAAAAHPHDRDTFYVIPLDPGHGRCMPDGHAAVWRTRDAGSTWQRLDRGLPQRGRAPRRARARGWRSTRTTCPASTSARAPGQVFASADEGESWSEIASYLPAISSVEVAIGRVADGRRCTCPPPCRRSSTSCRAARRRRGDGRRGDRPARRALARPARPALRARARRSAGTSTSTSTASARGSTRRSSRTRGVDVIAAISGG